MMKNHIFTNLLVCATCFLVSVCPVTAQIVEGTRVDVAEQQKSITIEVNNTASQTDDLVRLGSSIPCRAKVEGSPANDVTIVLTRTADRISFSLPTNQAGGETLALTLAKDGKWSDFTIAGVGKSTAAKDVKVEARKDNATGDILDSKDLSVFWFSDAAIELSNNLPSANYVLQPAGRNVVYAPNSVAMSMVATIKLNPQGLSAAAPQIARLRLGVQQQVDAGTIIRNLYSPPVIDSPTQQWLKDSKIGTTYYFPSLLVTNQLISLEKPYNDIITVGVYKGPLYDEPRRLSTNGLTSFYTSDTPYTFPPSNGYVLWRYREAGPNNEALDIADLKYYDIAAQSRKNEFHTWAVLGEYNGTELQNREYIAESTWTLNIDSSKANQHAIVTGDSGPAVTKRPTDTPVANNSFAAPNVQTVPPFTPIRRDP